ncbi:MAG: hypothetical protein U0X20_00370 [Caldilineaceae bacterium]
MAEQTTPSSDDHLLSMLAFQLRLDPDYMSNVIFRYQASENLDGRQVSSLLSIPEEQLTRLALCRRPRQTGQNFAAEVHQLAAYSGADLAALASMIRQVDALAALQQGPEAGSAETLQDSAWFSQLGRLAAARDRDEEQDEAGADYADEEES